MSTPTQRITISYHATTKHYLSNTFTAKLHCTTAAEHCTLRDLTLPLPEHDFTGRFYTWPPLNFSRHGPAKPTQRIMARDKTMLYPGDTSNCLTSPWQRATILHVPMPILSYAFLCLYNTEHHRTIPQPSFASPRLTLTKQCLTMPMHSTSTQYHTSPLLYWNYKSTDSQLIPPW